MFSSARMCGRFGVNSHLWTVLMTLCAGEMTHDHDASTAGDPFA
jgi:hypothetical protein